MILFPLFINTSVDWKKFDRAADSTVSMVVRWFHSWTFSAHGSVDEQWKAFITLKCVIVLIHQRLSLRGKTLRKNNKDDVQCPNNRLCEACLNCSWTLWDLTRWRNYENPVPGRQTGDHLCYTSWGAVTVNHHSVWSPPPTTSYGVTAVALEVFLQRRWSAASVYDISHTKVRRGPQAVPEIAKHAAAELYGSRALQRLSAGA